MEQRGIQRRARRIGYLNVHRMNVVLQVPDVSSNVQKVPTDAQHTEDKVALSPFTVRHSLFPLKTRLGVCFGCLL